MTVAALLLLHETLSGRHAVVQAYPTYQDQIPNCHAVPDPCYIDTVWAGVGHENSLGTCAINPFGIDFEANGNVTKTGKHKNLNCKIT